MAIGRVLAVLSATGPAAEANQELLAVARRLADQAGGHVTALLLGDANDAAGAFAHGADEAVTATAPWLEGRSAEACAEAIAAACIELQPAVVLLTHDDTGRDTAPGLAAHLGGALISDCVAIGLDGATGALTGTRPCFSGKALSEWVADGSGPKVATIRPRSMAPAAPPAPRTGVPRILPLPVTVTLRTRVLERVAPPAGQARLEDADVVIAVGRGVGSREAFQRYFSEGLAKALGAPCGGSRGAVDMGIVPPEWQIGLTGRIVSPKLYVAVGLSGSPQHMAGCSGAQTIVAVNTDPQAPIFGFAHYGVVGDYREAVPALTARLQELLAAGR
jgi:electron transfer flavoprotein alpha subunit